MLVKQAGQVYQFELSDLYQAPETAKEDEADNVPKAGRKIGELEDDNARGIPDRNALHNAA